MKRIIILLAAVALFVVSCRRNTDAVSSAYSVSYPVVKITSDTFFTLLQGSLLPANITATAYDTFYKKSLDSVIQRDYSSVNMNVPGFYAVTFSAKNQAGYVGYAYAYINVVASLSSMTSLTGRYKQMTNGDTVYLTPKVNHAGDTVVGFYTINNVAGVHSSYDSVSYITAAWFAQQSNSQITVPTQYTGLGLMTFANPGCIVASADTAFQYQVINPDFGASLRVFKKF